MVVDPLDDGLRVAERRSPMPGRYGATSLARIFAPASTTNPPPEPWLTTVAATSSARVVQGLVGEERLLAIAEDVRPGALLRDRAACREPAVGVDPALTTRGSMPAAAETSAAVGRAPGPRHRRPRRARPPGVAVAAVGEDATDGRARAPAASAASASPRRPVARPSAAAESTSIRAGADPSLPPRSAVAIASMPVDRVDADRNRRGRRAGGAAPPWARARRPGTR